MPIDDFYQIRVKGYLDGCWSAWFDGLTISYDESGDTLLSGPVPDQAALHGLLAKVRDLGLPLLSVNRIEPTDIEEHNADKEPLNLAPRSQIGG